jgi:hypothetical protein
LPELERDGVTLVYQQSGAGPDIVWLAAGDNPGENWRPYQTPAFDKACRNGSAFGHRPQVVNDCLRSIIELESPTPARS